MEPSFHCSQTTGGAGVEEKAPGSAGPPQAGLALTPEGFSHRLSLSQTLSPDNRKEN